MADPSTGAAGRLIGSALHLPLVADIGRAAADWVDLERSSLLATLRSLAPRTRGRLLDVGCGDKPYEEIFAPFVDSYVGVERESTYLSTNASASAVKADVLYEGDRLPFADQSFDTVISVQVLEHTPEPMGLFAEMVRVLKRGGLLIVCVPFSFRLHEEPHDYFRFTPHVMRKMCLDAELAVEQIVHRGSLWSVVAHKLNSYLALQVARMGSVAQTMGKHTHEQAQRDAARLWAMPAVVPAMFGMALGARVLDRVLPDLTEMLGFVVVARRPAPAPQGAT